ncbi:MAG: VWA domain-containing protein, partial [Bosea sp. (in: a-proteobacteria)]
DYRIVFVGDAAMSPYEIAMPNGSVEHMNEEAGQIWMERMTSHFQRAVWLNPVPRNQWNYTQSTLMMGGLMGGRMYELTLDGLERAIKELGR